MAKKDGMRKPREAAKPVAQPEAVAVSIAPEAITVNLKVPKEDPRSTYWMGALPSCPFFKIDIAGLDFPKFHEKVAYADTPSASSRLRKRGAPLRKLTATQVEAIKEGVVCKVLRSMGKKTRLMSTKKRGFIPSRFDQPVAAYLFLMKIGNEENINFEAVTPTPMYVAPKPEEEKATA